MNRCRHCVAAPRWTTQGRTTMRLFPLFGLATLLGALTAVPAAGQERYFVMVFGSQKSYATPQYTHSWAVFVRSCGPCPANAELDYITISWLSERMVVDIKKLRPEPGV